MTYKVHQYDTDQISTHDMIVMHEHSLNYKVNHNKLQIKQESLLNIV